MNTTLAMTTNLDALAFGIIAITLLVIGVFRVDEILFSSRPRDNRTSRRSARYPAPLASDDELRVTRHRN